MRTLSVVIAIPLGEHDDGEEMAHRIVDAANEADVPNLLLGKASYNVRDESVRSALVRTCAAIDA